MANNSDIEIWKDIPNYEGYYQASNLGNIRSLDRLDRLDSLGRLGRERKGMVLKKTLSNRGYYGVSLSKKGKNISHRIHVLVASVFLEHTPCGHEVVVDHIDNDKLNNRVNNLQLITQRQNSSKDRKGGSSKYVGVFWYKASKKWESMIGYKGKQIYLGRFKNELDAAASYNLALERVNKGLAPK
jgi:hypothetical protein